MIGLDQLLAVLVGAVATFVVGGIWYSPMLFQRAWMKANNLTDADLAAGGTGNLRSAR